MTDQSVERVICGHCENIFPVRLPEPMEPIDVPDSSNSALRIVAGVVLKLGRSVSCPYCKTAYYHNKGRWYGQVMVELKKYDVKEHSRRN